uniref:Zf-BED domain-containing protein n=1 Tax=Tanacetum cinerariifolium TaxID=118510 RepID=A0A6L2NW03_TANCI|nr:zf-BED domain-containing protein [Tanacetum cinerariifolium]
MANESNDARLQILMKLQEELDMEVVLEKQMLNLFALFLEQVQLHSQYAVSIKEDTAYLCLQSPNSTETKLIRRIQEKAICLAMTKVIKGEFKTLETLKINDVLLTYDTSLEFFHDEFNRLSNMDDDLFTYKMTHESDNDMEYDQSDDEFTTWLALKFFNYKMMDHYTMRALWIYWLRGDDEVELTDGESSDSNNEGEVAGTPLPRFKRYEALKDSEMKEEALRNKAIMKGLINDDVESNNEDDEERCELFDDATQEFPVCTIRRFKMKKYSYGQDEEMDDNKSRIKKLKKSLIYRLAKTKVLPERQPGLLFFYRVCLPRHQYGREFTRRLNGLIGEMNEACADRIAFVQELWSVPGESVPAKTAVFLEEMMNKEGGRECQLADLVNEGREMVREIKFFMGKLMRNARS